MSDVTSPDVVCPSCHAFLDDEGGEGILERLAEERLGGLGELGVGCSESARGGDTSAGGLVMRRAAGGLCRSCGQCSMFAVVTEPVRSWAQFEAGHQTLGV